MNQDEEPEIRLDLINRAENVGLVRHTLGGVADALAIDDATLADIKIAVSEACNNVVQHAYEGDEGPLQVDISPAPDELRVVVRDQGMGIQPNPPDPEGKMQGVGLSLIQALTAGVEFHGGPNEGTEVRMAFAIPGLVQPPPGLPQTTATEPPSGDVVLTVRSPELAPAVLGCVVAFLGAQAGFSLERVSETQMLTDALGEELRKGILRGQLHVAVSIDGRSLEIAISPLDPDEGSRLLRDSQLPSVRSLFERLADEVSVAREASTEQLRLRVAARN